MSSYQVRPVGIVKFFCVKSVTEFRVGNLKRPKRYFDCFAYHTNLNVVLKVAVNTVRILSKSCMFFCVLRFAKNTNFLLKGGIHCFSMSIFRMQFRFSQVPRLVEFWTEYIWYKLQPKATQSTNNTANVSVNLHGISDTSTHGATP